MTAVDEDGTPRGHCSECITDIDCRVSELGRSCSRANEGQHYVCTSGALGDACDSDDSCEDGLRCASIGPGAERCSLCDRDNQCDDESGEVCGGLEFNLAADGRVRAHRVCAGRDTLERDRACAPGDSGNAACRAYCVGVRAGSDAVTVGVCGDCRPGEDDCAGDGECREPSSSGAVLMGSLCPGGSDSGDESSSSSDEASTDDSTSTDATTTESGSDSTDASSDATTTTGTSDTSDSADTSTDTGSESSEDSSSTTDTTGDSTGDSSGDSSSTTG